MFQYLKGVYEEDADSLYKRNWRDVGQWVQVSPEEIVIFHNEGNQILK